MRGMDREGKLGAGDAMVEGNWARRKGSERMGIRGHIMSIIDGDRIVIVGGPYQAKITTKGRPENKAGKQFIAHFPGRLDYLPVASRPSRL